MKLVHKLIAWCASTRLVWPLVSPLAKFGNAVTMHRNMMIADREAASRQEFLKKKLEPVIAQGEVLSGPCQGMKYPAFTAIGSTLFPKLLGTYERELATVMNEICSRPFTNVINIGCGEGYYAVGLALRVPTCHVYAFD